MIGCMRLRSGRAASSLSRASAASTALAVAAGADGLDALDLLGLEGGVDAEDLDRLLVVVPVAVDADDDALAGLDLGLVAEGGVGDLALHEVLLDRGDHAAELVDPVEVLVGLPLQLRR